MLHRAFPRIHSTYPLVLGWYANVVQDKQGHVLFTAVGLAPEQELEEYWNQWSVFRVTVHHFDAIAIVFDPRSAFLVPVSILGVF